MFRFLLVLLVAVCIAGGVAYSTGWLDEYINVGPSSTNVIQPSGDKADAVLGELLYKVEQPIDRDTPPRSQIAAKGQLVVDPCHVVVRDKQEVSSAKDGNLMFVGVEVTDKNPGQVNPLRPVQPVRTNDGEKNIVRKYRAYEVNDFVDYDQIVAVMNDTMAVRDVESKEAKLTAAENEHKASDAILRETQKRLDKMKQMRGASKGAVSDLEIGDSEVAVAKYNGEAVSKFQAIKVAEKELAQARVILDLHYLRNQLQGRSVIKTIYKTAGYGIKPQEPVLELWNLNRLRIEGSVDSQYAGTLLAHLGTSCYLEPSEEMHPKQELMKAHRDEVTCVAVCADGERFVSGSEDHTVLVWQRGLQQPLHVLQHDAAVRSLACSPKGDWLLVGCVDGTISKWDLNNPKEAQKFEEKHQGSVTALAFSPDGDWFASGGEDNTILLWKTEAGAVQFPFDADHGVKEPHQGTITSLNFTPQSTLISAARDNTLRVWELHEKGAKKLVEVINRGGTVNQLGVSADGRFMLFDKGKTLQLLNTFDGSTVCPLDNLGGANPFDTLALFSPDGSLMLTGGAGEGRLHLWKTPTPQERAFQVRELVTRDRAAITSAAFAPGGHGFAVTGSKQGYVHLWSMPDKKTVDTHCIKLDANGQALRLDLVEYSIEAGKTRVAVNVLNPIDQRGALRLKPGQRVTLVVELQPVGK